MHWNVRMLIPQRRRGHTTPRHTTDDGAMKFPSTRSPSDVQPATEGCTLQSQEGHFASFGGTHNNT